MMPIKILAINASHRDDRGYIRLFIDKLLQGAVENRAECEVVTLARLKINRCLACLQCQTEEHYLHCVQEHDDVHAIHDNIAAADLLFMAHPCIFTPCPACSSCSWSGSMASRTCPTCGYRM
jgi:multimeric flavodoxin WrbA